MSNIPITKTTNSRIDSIDWDNLGFGVHFSDHIYVSEFKHGKWSEGEIKPYGTFEIEPAMCTLHYGQAIFEGMKAFNDVNGGINLFRPDMNAKRLNHSAERICIPVFNEYHFLDVLQDLVRVDKDFVPKKRGSSLYIRPVAFGDGNFLGVHASDTYKLIIMTSPVSSYYKEGLNPVSILVSDEFVRAARGGTGTAKTAGNYAASLLAGKKAREAGYSQVLWLDAVERKFVDEVGAMNIMFVIGDELITPPLDQGSILAGVTRDSVLKLAEQESIIKPVERSITVDELFEAHRNGDLKEIFGTGTAAVISPVGKLDYKGEQIIVNDGKIGPVAQKFYDLITGLQYGEIEDKNEWIVHIDV